MRIICEASHGDLPTLSLLGNVPHAGPDEILVGKLNLCAVTLCILPW